MFKLQLMLYATLFFVFSFLISTATALSSLSISPSPFSLTNETVDVGQISISNTVASGGTGGYTGNWEWIPPSSSNVPAFNTIMAALPSSNALTMTINAISSNEVSFSFNGAVYNAIAIGSNTIYGDWTINGLIEDSSGSSSVATSNSIMINAAPYLSSAFSPSNILLDYGQSTTYAFSIGGGTGPFTANLVKRNIGAWSKTNPYPTNVYYNSCDTYSGYVYCIGGEASVGSTTYATNSVYYAQLLPNGVGSWQSASPYPANVYRLGCSAYSNYIYCVGGVGAANSVYYAQIDNPGIGAWQPGPNVPISGTIGDATCPIYNGTIYCNYQDTLYYASVSASGGIGQWQTQTTNVYSPFCHVSSGYIYCLGDGTSFIYYAKLLKTGTSSWTQTSRYPFPPASYSAPSCSVNSYFIYCVGDGNGNSGFPENKTYFSITSSNGGLSSWIYGTPYLSNTTLQPCVSSSNNIYCIGGYETYNPYPYSYATNNVYYAEIASVISTNSINKGASNGELSVSQLSVGNQSYELSVSDIGTNTPFTEDLASNTIRVAPATSTVSPTLNSTKLDLGSHIKLSEEYATNGISPYSYNFIISNSVSGQEIGYTGYNAYDYSIFTPTNTGNFAVNVIVKDSATSPFFANSILSEFSVNSMPTVTISPSNVVLDTGQYESYYSTINGGTGPEFGLAVGNSSAPTWTAANTYPYPYYVNGEVRVGPCPGYGGYIYCIGNALNNGAGEGTVEYAPINSEGVGPWIESSYNYPDTTAFEFGNIYNACSAYAGYIYCVGTYEGNTIYYSKITGNSPGQWIQTKSYPLSVIMWDSCPIYNGYIYCVGVYDGYSEDQQVYYAQVSSSGVGNWIQANPYPAPIYTSPNCVTNNGYVYCVGGAEDICCYYTVGINESYYAPLSANGAIGSWSATTGFPLDGNTLVYFQGSDSQNQCAVSGNFIYCSTFLNKASTYYAPLSSNGIGNWVAMGSIYPQYSSCSSTNSYVYCISVNQSFSYGYSGSAIGDYYIKAIKASNIINGIGGSGTITFQPSGIGRKSYTVVGTDSGTSTPFIFNSISNTIVINPALSNSIIVSNSQTVTEGDKVLFNVTASGGTPPYTYNFIVLDPGNIVYASGYTNSNAFSYTTNSVGAFTLEVDTEDSATTNSITTNSVNFTVLQPISSSPTAPPPLSVTLSDNVSENIQSNKPVLTAAITDLSENKIESYAEYYQNQLPVTVSFGDNYALNISYICAFNSGSFNYTYAGFIQGIGIASCGKNYIVYGGSYSALYSKHKNQNATATATTTMPITPTTTVMPIPGIFHKFISISKGLISKVKIQNSGSYLSISTASNNVINASITVANNTAESPNIPAMSKLMSLLINVTGSNLTIAATLQYPCDIPPRSVSPYILTNKTWEKIGNFTTNQISCAISFVVPSDPTVGIFTNYTSVTTSEQTTSTTVNVTLPININSQGNNNEKYAIYGLIIIIIALIAIYARIRNGRRQPRRL